MAKIVYKLHCINGRFDHAYGIAAAVERANQIVRAAYGDQEPLSEKQLAEECSWTFTPLTPAQANAVGM